MDECEEDIHVCSQNCHNSVGSYVCTCDAGYIISSDGITCIGELNIRGQSTFYLYLILESSMLLST